MAQIVSGPGAAVPETFPTWAGPREGDPRHPRGAWVSDPRSDRLEPPDGFDEIVRFYGDPRLFVREDGTLDPAWERDHLQLVEIPFALTLAWPPYTPVRKLRVHIKLAGPVWRVFHDILDAGLHTEVTEYGGAFNFRAQRGSAGRKLSLHAFGAAVDLNPRTNRLGTTGDMHPGVVQLFEAHGFEWGGRYRRPDPMHFSFSRSY